MSENRHRHVRVAYQVVRTTDEFIAAKSADFDELVIAVGDGAVGIGSGNEVLLSREATVATAVGLVYAHWLGSLRLSSDVP